MRAVVALAVAAISGASTGAAEQGPERVEIRKEAMAPRVYRLVRVGEGEGNVLAFTGPEGTVLVDAGRRSGAEALADTLATIQHRPPRFVINTHYHDDHLGLNPRLRAAGSEIVGHRNLAAQARKDTTIGELDWHRVPAAPGALPVLTFADRLTLFLNGDTIDVTHPPAAHTDGDAVVFARRANVLHTGDILELGAYPFIRSVGRGLAGGHHRRDRRHAGDGERAHPGGPGARAGLGSCRSHGVS